MCYPHMHASTHFQNLIQQNYSAKNSANASVPRPIIPTLAVQAASSLKLIRILKRINLILVFKRGNINKCQARSGPQLLSIKKANAMDIRTAFDVDLGLGPIRDRPRVINAPTLIAIKCKLKFSRVRFLAR